MEKGKAGAVHAVEDMQELSVQAAAFTDPRERTVPGRAARNTNILKILFVFVQYLKYKLFEFEQLINIKSIYEDSWQLWCQENAALKKELNRSRAEKINRRDLRGRDKGRGS